MPNCDFYAAGQDFDDVLKFIFEALQVRVLEAYSAVGAELQEFKSLKELLASEPYGKLKNQDRSLHLALWPVEASDSVRIKKVSLNPLKCSGHMFRYKAEGWGLIQLYLCSPTGKGLKHCHTNHNTAARAEKWASTYPDLGSPSDWKWSVVSSVSGKLNRYIRKSAASKIGSRPVLPLALEIVGNGQAAV